MRRAMEVLRRVGPQETKDVFPNPIDHPYFGQIFLAGALQLVGYPNSLNPSMIVNGSASSNTAVHITEMLWLIPRVLIGLLAVADTFLIYKIAERRFTCNVLINLNGMKPNQNAVAAGPGGPNDYSKWNALLTSKYTSVKQGNNKINARINCSDIHGLAAHFNLRTSVNVRVQ